MLKMFVAGAGGLALAGMAAAANISGAGATFPAPIYAKWAESYRAQTGIGLNYQPIGSGGGIKQITAQTVDFGASDKPLTPRDLNKHGLYQFPTVIGGVVPVVNLPGVRPGQIRLSGALLADIFLGRIRRWNAPQIAAANRGLALPNLPITVVHRSDGSGTTFLFTTYLERNSSTWQQQVGASDAVQWPTGIGGKGNDGVAAFVKQTAGAIGYVEYAYAKQNGGAFIQLRNKAGQFVSPSAQTFAAAAASADWLHSPGNRIILVDQPGAGAWPIIGATFILVHRSQANGATGAQVLKFFDWAFAKGDAQAAALDYVSVPTQIEGLLKRQWARSITAGGKPVYVAK
ncbi:phosphate ABC transporter substrate-binding protein PstS [uncultured Sphingomonas sp.]|mgnify:CR=1 FL=1|uniref:phosphate ABC transporter substrate-binding protein PstS n=1 Tax=uncultured Sphingomonas sp. TaxID=158754 RepID=UPI0025EE327E|nr:phosphate ABC transporter substrate-binding protein PstS [uncultured Sphingomonas sp.]